MRWIVVALALLITATPAVAQEEAANVWTHPQGYYSLDITGWRRVDFGPDAQELAAFGRGDTEVTRLCVINEAAAPSPVAQSQEVANGFPEVFVPVERSGDVVSNMRRLRVGGVVIAAYNVTNAERGIHDAYRVFSLSKPVTLTQISCGGRNTSETDRAEFERLLDSITFTFPEQSP